MIFGMMLGTLIAVTMCESILAIHGEPGHVVRWLGLPEHSDMYALPLMLASGILGVVVYLVAAYPKSKRSGFVPLPQERSK